MRPVAEPRRSCWPPRAALRTPTRPKLLVGTGLRCRGSRPEVTSTQRPSNELCPGSRRQPTSWPKPTPSSPRSIAGSLQPPLDRLMQEAKDEIRARVGAGHDGGQPGGAPAADARCGRRADLSARDPLPVRPARRRRISGRLRVAARGWEQAVAFATSRRRPQIPKVKPVPGPADAKKAWGWAGIDRIFWDTTYTPDFPTAAGFMKGIWEAGGGEARGRRDRGRPGADGVVPAGRRSGRLSGVARDDHRRQRRSRSSAPTSTRQRPGRSRTRGRSASVRRSGTRCSPARGPCRRWRPRCPAPLTADTCRCGARGRTSRLRWERSG